jgi:hypothetical protein
VRPHDPHRPPASPAAVQSAGDDPAALDVSLPSLPLGTTLDPEVLHGAACGENDLQLFYPEPGDQAAEQAAKAICAACRVKDAAWRWRW